MGSEFRQILTQRSFEFSAPDEKIANILDHEAIEELVKTEKPDVIINCAAYNAVDDAETHSELAFKVNFEAVRALAEICLRRQILLVHFSSDYVFDGTKEGFYEEDDVPSPLNVYGKSKLAGEKAVLDTLPQSLVFRLSWVIGKGKQNFLYKLSQWAQKNQVLRISADETSVPTFTDDIVNVTLLSIDKGLQGLFHLASNGYASRYELARYYLSNEKLNNIVIPVPITYFNTLAERPLFSVMSNNKVSEALDIQLGDWRNGVDRYRTFFRND